MKFEKFINGSLIVPTLLCSEALTLRLGELLAASDLSITESLILLAIFFEEKDDVRPSELSHTLKISRARVSQGIKTLSRKALILRKIGAVDARFINLVLTAKGRALAPKLIRAFDSINSKIEARLSDEQVTRTAKILLDIQALGV